jgi:hypothetical protein
MISDIAMGEVYQGIVFTLTQYLHYTSMLHCATNELVLLIRRVTDDIHIMKEQ